MSLSDFIEKLQNKPWQTRIKILWGAVAISMLVILPLWFFSFKSSLSKNGQSKKEDNKEIGELTKSIKEIGKEIPSLKKSLQASIGSFFNRSGEEKNSSAKPVQSESKSAKETVEEIQPAKLPLSE